MAQRELTVVAGALSLRHKKVSSPRAQDDLAKRWRKCGSATDDSSTVTSDVIPLLDGWIRRLEREAGSTAQER